MEKIFISSLVALTLLSVGVSPLVHAEQVAPECSNTWMQSEASKSCGENYCTYKNMIFLSRWGRFDRHPDKVFVSRYDAPNNECTFETLCATTPDKDLYLRNIDNTLEGYYILNGKEISSTCEYTYKTVKVDGHLKNQNGQLVEVDGAA